MLPHADLYCKVISNISPLKKHQSPSTSHNAIDELERESIISIYKKTNKSPNNSIHKDVLRMSPTSSTHSYPSPNQLNLFSNDHHHDEEINDTEVSMKINTYRDELNNQSRTIIEPSSLLKSENLIIQSLDQETNTTNLFTTLDGIDATKNSSPQGTFTIQLI